jgi:hypothetical protein
VRAAPRRASRAPPSLTRAARSRLIAASARAVPAPRVSAVRGLSSAPEPVHPAKRLERLQGNAPLSPIVTETVETVEIKGETGPVHIEKWQLDMRPPVNMAEIPFVPDMTNAPPGFFLDDHTDDILKRGAKAMAAEGNILDNMHLIMGLDKDDPVRNQVLWKAIDKYRIALPEDHHGHDAHDAHHDGHADVAHGAAAGATGHGHDSHAVHHATAHDSHGHDSHGHGHHAAEHEYTPQDFSDMAFYFERERLRAIAEKQVRAMPAARAPPSCVPSDAAPTAMRMRSLGWTRTTRTGTPR